MEVRYLKTEVTLGKGDSLDIIVYVDNGGDFLSPVRINIIGGHGYKQDKAFMSVEDLSMKEGDAPEYFITNKGLQKSPML